MRNEWRPLSRLSPQHRPDLKECLPVRKEDLLGVHRGAAAKCWVSLTPSSASRSILGVLSKPHRQSLSGQGHAFSLWRSMHWKVLAECISIGFRSSCIGFRSVLQRQMDPPPKQPAWAHALSTACYKRCGALVLGSSAGAQPTACISNIWAHCVTRGSWGSGTSFPWHPLLLCEHALFHIQSIVFPIEWGQSAPFLPRPPSFCADGL